MFFGNMFGGGGFPSFGSPFGGGFGGYGGGMPQFGGGGFGGYGGGMPQFGGGGFGGLGGGGGGFGGLGGGGGGFGGLGGGGFLGRRYSPQQFQPQQMAYNSLNSSVMQPVFTPPQQQQQPQNYMAQERNNLMMQNFNNRGNLGSSRGMGRPAPMNQMGNQMNQMGNQMNQMQQPSSREEMFQMAKTNPQYAQNMDLNRMFGDEEAGNIRSNLGIGGQMSAGGTGGMNLMKNRMNAMFSGGQKKIGLPQPPHTRNGQIGGGLTGVPSQMMGFLPRMMGGLFG